MIRFRPLPGLTFATLIGLAALVALGMWQLERLAWKRALIAAAESRAHAAPVAIDGLLALPAGEIEYAHATAAGTFLAGEAYIFTKLEDGRLGFKVIAPFRLRNGAAILIDRGFVPSLGSRPGAHPPPPAGMVEATGLIRNSEPSGVFTPKADLANRIWYGRDAQSIAAVLGVPAAVPLFLAEDAGPEGELPEGGHTKLTFRNQHLEYALTWFALAGVLIGVYLAYHRSKGRLQF